MRKFYGVQFFFWSLGVQSIEHLFTFHPTTVKVLAAFFQFVLFIESLLTSPYIPYNTYSMY